MDNLKIEKKIFTLKSDFDELPLAVMLWHPIDCEIRAVVQISHGMCEHKERYEDFMQFLCQNGFAVIIHDHRGHGDSVLEKSDLGFFYDSGATASVSDMYQITLYAKRIYPDKPFFVFAHSMGTLITRAYMRYYDKSLDGVILCGSPSYNRASGIGTAVIKAAIKKDGERYRTEKLSKMGYDIIAGKFKREGAHAFICSDKSVVEAYDNDEKCNYIFTLNGYLTLLTLMEEAYKKLRKLPCKRTLPIWFISGSDDPFMISRQYLFEAMTTLNYQGYENVSFHIYKKLRHELINEIEKEKVYADILEKINHWLKK